MSEIQAKEPKVDCSAVYSPRHPLYTFARIKSQNQKPKSPGALDCRAEKKNCWHNRCLRYRLHPLPDGGGDKHR